MLLAAQVSLPFQLSLLPQAKQQTALYAFCFSMTATSSSNTTDYPLTFSEYTDIFWQVLGRESRLRSLHCTRELCHESRCNHPDLSEHFMACIAKLTALQSLNVGHLELRGPEIAKILKRLRCQATLENLDLSQNSIHYGDGSAAEIVQCLIDFMALCRLDILQEESLSGAVKACQPCFSQLSCLESVHFSGNGDDIRQNALIQMGECLSKCPRLHTIQCANHGCHELLRNRAGCSLLKHVEIMLDARSLPGSFPDEDSDSEDGIPPLLKYYAPPTVKVWAPMSESVPHISRLTGLERLHIHTDNADYDWSLLFKSVAPLSSLTALHIGCSAGEVTNVLSALTQLLSAHLQLQELHLVHTVVYTGFMAEEANDLIDGAAAHDLSLCISKAPMLTHLRLWCTFKHTESAHAVTCSHWGLSGLAEFLIVYQTA